METNIEQQPANCLKIVIFGPESTGKSTLAEDLAKHYNDPWVAEYMRPYLEEKLEKTGERISQSDLVPIAAGQMADENRKSSEAVELLFCDTNLLELQVYSEYYYDGYCPDEIKAAVTASSYDFYLLMDVDIPWVQDELRDRPDDRLSLFRIFEQALQQRDLPYAVVSGSGEQRLKTAINLIDKLRRGEC